MGKGSTGVSGARVRRWSALAATALLVSTGAARANDGGIFGFFEQAFGGARGASTRTLPQPDDAFSDSPPLTVRAHPRRHNSFATSRSPKETLAAIKGVTIYTDRTLQRGDAVMTAHGMRVFNGSESWPYTNDDFVAVSSIRSMPVGMRKELRAIDVASRAELAR